MPDETQRAAIRLAADHLETVGNAHSPLLGAALGVHAWLDQGGERPPLRAALALYWQRRRVTALPCPLLTGAAALGADIPWARDDWIGHFLAALAGEAEDGLALLARLERHWFAARAAVAGRRRDSRAAAAIDILAAAPLVSATTLGHALGIATNNATRLLDGFVGLGIASEVSQRAKRRLYGLKHLAPLREATAPPRRPMPGRRPAGRVPPLWLPIPAARLPIRAFRLVPSPPLPPLERQKFDFSDIDRLLDLTDQAIRRTQRVLEVQSTRPSAGLTGWSPRSLAVRANEIALLGKQIGRISVRLDRLVLVGQSAPAQPEFDTFVRMRAQASELSRPSSRQSLRVAYVAIAVELATAELEPQGAIHSVLDEGPSAITPEFPADWEHENTTVVAKVRLNGNGVKRIGASNDESSNVPAIKGTKALALECQSVRTHER